MFQDEAEDEEYDEFSPLVMDTSKTEFAPLAATDTLKSEENSVKESIMPQKALYSIKPTLTELPVPGLLNSGSAGSSAVPSPSTTLPSPAPSNELTNDRSRLSSVANSTHSSDGMSPVLRPIDSTNQNEAAGQSKRDARQGSKVKRVM